MQELKISPTTRAKFNMALAKISQSIMIHELNEK